MRRLYRAAHGLSTMAVVGVAVFVGTLTIAVARGDAAQEGSLHVTVKDATGAVVIGARVVSTHDGLTREAPTDSRGIAVITGLGPGPATVRVESPGFEPRVVTLRRVRQPTRLTVELEIAGLAVSINVSRDAREKGLDPRGEAFSRVLSADVIAMLPDDPDELEKVLTQMGGPGATFRVNGFGGTRLPPKNRIRQIRFSLNSFSAELHELGTPIVDIMTQPGSARWHGSIGGSFRNPGLNARHPYASVESPERSRRVGVTLDGPLWRNRTSMSIAADAAALSDAQTFRASGPAGLIAGVALRRSDRSNVAVEVLQSIGGAHTARLELSRIASAARNLGVGGADLPERAYSTEFDAATVRLAESGPIGRHLFHTARAQIASASSRGSSVTSAPAVVVLDAFNAGGAQIDYARQALEIDIGDDLDFARGRHAMRAGVLFQYGRYDMADAGNGFGTFTFSSLESYLAAAPATYTRRFGDPSYEYRMWRAGWFVQDDLKLHKSLTGSVGLRQEMQSHVDDRLNPSPRLGFTWAPRADGTLLLRGGVGLVYSWFEPSLYDRIVRLDGEQQFEILAIDPPFPTGPSTGDGVSLLPRNRYVMGANLRLPQVLSTSVAVQRQFNVATMARVTYTHQRGGGVFRGRRLTGPGADNTIAAESTGRSRLDRVEIAATHVALRNGRARYMLNGSYTWARQYNDTDGAFSVPSNLDQPSLDWGPAAGDVRHRAAVMASVGLPWGLHAMAVAAASSAPPFNITTGIDENRDAIFNERPVGVGRNSGRASAELDIAVRVGWTIGFGGTVAQETPSNLKRLAADAQRDVLGTVNAALGRSAPRYRFELFAQVYNVPNVVNRTGYRGVLTSPFFGEATASMPPRRIELGARFDF